MEKTPLFPLEILRICGFWVYGPIIQQSEMRRLRNANYYQTALLKSVEEAAKDVFWKLRLDVVDKARMEDLEFISELYFLIAEDSELTANPKKMDELYASYSKKNENEIARIYERFLSITVFLTELKLDYAKYHIGGVSHLYGLFAFAKHCEENGIKPSDISKVLNDFYLQLRNQDFANEHIKEYKVSMSARTKDAGSRRKRKKALLAYCTK